MNAKVMVEKDNEASDTVGRTLYSWLILEDRGEIGHAADDIGIVHTVCVPRRQRELEM